MPCQNPQARQKQQHSEERRRRRRRLPRRKQKRREEWAGEEWGEAEPERDSQPVQAAACWDGEVLEGLSVDWEQWEGGSGSGEWGVGSKLVTRWGCRFSSCWLRLFFARRFNEWGMRLHENCLRTIWATVSCECYPHTQIDTHTLAYTGTCNKYLQRAWPAATLLKAKLTRPG